MAGEYLINWTDDSLKPPFVLNPNTKDTVTTALTLNGKGAKNYGEGLQENLVRLLEHFCSTQSPAIKTMGQGWFDAASKTFKIWDGSKWAQVGVQISSSNPSEPSPGNIWLDSLNNSLKFWNGTTWVPLASVSDLSTHAGNFNLHLTPEQNSLLDNLASISSADLNNLSGSTGNIQAQINAEVIARQQSDTVVKNDLNTHIADTALHLTSAQNSWIDAITVSSSEVNRLSGLTSNVQGQLNAETLARQQGDTGIQTDLNTHKADMSVHLTPSQNAWIDAINASSTELNYLVGVTSGIQSQFDTVSQQISDRYTKSEIVSQFSNFKNTSNVWTKSQTGSIANLADTATYILDLSSSNNFALTLTANRSMGAPINLSAGQCGFILVNQDAVGSKTLTFSSVFKFSNGEAPVLSTAGNAVDVIVYLVDPTGSKLLCNFIPDVR